MTKSLIFTRVEVAMPIASETMCNDVYSMHPSIDPHPWIYIGHMSGIEEYNYVGCGALPMM